MPLNKYFQFFVLHNALHSKLPLHDVCYAIDVSQKTASLLARRVQPISYTVQFAKIDKATYQAAAESDDDNSEKESSAFFSYCEIKSIAVSDALFRQFLHEVSQKAVTHIEQDTPAQS